MKSLVLLMVLTVGIGPQITSADYLDYLLATNDLVEVPERSKTNLGSDKLYIEDYGKEEHEFMMSYQLYLPNKGGPGEQSAPFPVKMINSHPTTDEEEDVGEEETIKA